MVPFLICIAALGFLMLVAYRGFSVILFAPIAALAAVMLTSPHAVLPIYSGLFMESMVVFVKLYFPAFMLGALFGKVIELSGFAKSIVSAVIKVLGESSAIFSIVVVCALLTYFGVSLFVVVFAVYPFAAEMFRQGNIPKRLIPGTIALGSFTFTMDCLPGTPQIQNIIPTTFFHTTIYAAPILGTLGAIYILIIGMTYLEWCRRRAHAAGEGYGTGHINETVVADNGKLVPWWLAISPLLLVGVANWFFTKKFIPAWYGASSSIMLNPTAKPIVQDVTKLNGIWSVETALLLGILLVVIIDAIGYRRVTKSFAEGSKSAIAGALLASLNTASEYGFGAVIAVNLLAGITGSASGGMGIALAAMSNQFIAAANAHGIPMEVLHRVAAMASGGMDTMPHNGAVITLLMVTGLTHRQSYKDIFTVTCIKTSAVFVVIALYYLTHLV